MAVNVGSQRLYTKKGFLDAGMMPKTYSEIEASKFNGMLILCEDPSDLDHNGKYYCCIGGIVQEFKGASTGTSTGTGASIENFVKTVNGASFTEVKDTDGVTTAYYKVEVPATEHQLTNIVYADLVDAAYDPVDVSIQINQATQNVVIKTYATEAITGSYILILKGVK